MLDVPMDPYLENLAGFICDDDKLVTYKWLSKELEVHVNVAKRILSQYWQKYKGDNLVATFMLIGKLKTGGVGVEVVKESDREKAKEKFKEIMSEHVYSLQKSLLDVELLAGSDKGDSRFSAIVCDKSGVLNEEELTALRWGKAQAQRAASTDKKVEQATANKKEATVVKETPKKEEVKEPEAKSEEKTKKVSPPKQKSGDKKGIPKKPIQSTKAGFGHLFGKVGNQQKPQTVASSNGANSKNNADSERLAEAKENKKSSSDGSRPENSREVKQDSRTSSKSSASSPEEEKQEPKEKVAVVSKPEKTANGKSSKISKSKKTARGKKRARSQDSGEETKKRKRIVVASDSSEESETGSADEDMFDSPPPPSPPKEELRSPSPVQPSQQQGGRRKVKKLVDKTFMDEDGYLITRKEHVYESCSDEEVQEPPAKKVEVEKKKETKAAPVKKKQTSLMNFFKKS